MQIVRLLVVAGPDGLAAGALAETLEVSPSNVSFHLKELDCAGLIGQQREARSITYSANYEALGTAILVATVVGSGIMASRLTSDTALALLSNALATGAILTVLITVLAQIVGGMPGRCWRMPCSSCRAFRPRPPFARAQDNGWRRPQPPSVWSLSS